ncbi:hypothetical protein ACFSVN_04345 [Gracilimonas halophila]|uniref:Uncharacterized protein n=1 Tax=Gracilimonas halophila TaxID=1834464 RepID=A0ABW5JIR9_9BACT
MNIEQEILNSEVRCLVKLLTSPKSTASRSFCPSKGTQVLAYGDYMLAGQDSTHSQEPISLWRETGFSSTEIERENNVEKGTKVETRNYSAMNSPLKIHLS